jgi:phosphatidate cytidylyltransferase
MLWGWGENVQRVFSACVLLGIFALFLSVPLCRLPLLLLLMSGLFLEVTLAFKGWQQKHPQHATPPITRFTGAAILGGAWTVAAGAGWSLWWLLSRGPEGVFLALGLFMMIWAYDSGAYIGGRMFKGPLLAPRISPHKTWSGCLWGSVAVGVMLFCLGRLKMGVPFPLSWREGVCFLLLAQGGDLAESAAKRFFGLKDSSRLIPGHGGLWDRLDSTLFVFLGVGLRLLS